MTALQRCDWRSAGGSSSETTPSLLALLMWVLVPRPVSLHPGPKLPLSEPLRFKHADFFFISITAFFGSVSGMFVDLKEWASLARAAHLETLPSSGPGGGSSHSVVPAFTLGVEGRRCLSNASSRGHV